MRAKKIDRRMNGYGEFEYLLEFRKVEREDFCKYRAWCWEQWGASCEFEHWGKLNIANDSWCWGGTEFHNRIYFRNKSQYSWWLLAFGS